MTLSHENVVYLAPISGAQDLAKCFRVLSLLGHIPVSNSFSIGHASFLNYLMHIVFCCLSKSCLSLAYYLLSTDNSNWASLLWPLVACSCQDQPQHQANWQQLVATEPLLMLDWATWSVVTRTDHWEGYAAVPFAVAGCQGDHASPLPNRGCLRTSVACIT